jgi:phage terminase small subunit
MANNLTPRESLFVKNLSKGYNKQDSAKLAGYSDSSSTSYVSTILRKNKIIKALDKVGINDKYIARTLKTHIDEGLHIKPNSDTSLRALSLATQLHGYTEHDKPENMTQTNIYINELKMMSDDELQSKLNTLIDDVTSLKSSS